MNSKEPHKYPSELNTKSIACRIPMSDYIEIMQECMDKGIKINDWLLLKLYSKSGNSINGTNDSGFLSESDFSGNLEFKAFYRSVMNSIKDDNKSFKEALIEQIKAYIIEVQELRGKVPDFEEKVFNKIADLNDVKNQLTILIDNTFTDVRDKREYRKELFSLLKELSN